MRKIAGTLSLTHALICGSLTGDHIVTYCPSVTDDDHVFKALADPTRRFLLDLLFQRDGRTLKDLESGLEMTRFGVMKHLKVLEDAGLVVTRRSGREKLHFLNAVPIRMIHDRWIDKYRERRGLRAAGAQGRAGEKGRADHDGQNRDRAGVQDLSSRPSAQAIWDAITKPEWSERYAYGGRVSIRAEGRRHSITTGPAPR